MSQSTRSVLLTLSVIFAWALISLSPIWKYLSLPRAVAATLTSIGLVALGMYWLDRLNRKRSQVGIGWIFLLFLALSIAFGVLYPRSLRQPLRARSDREDALRIELNAVRQHQYPYKERTFLHNPPTPLPGAILLAAPFFAIGHIAWQNILWCALFFVFAVRYFRYRSTALFFLAVFLLFAPADLNDFVSGGDYVTNFFYFSIAVALFVGSIDRSIHVYVPAALFLGITLSSRGIYVLALIPLLAFTLQRSSRFRVLACFALVTVAAVAVTLPLFAPHPLTHLAQELNETSAGKLRFIPRAFHPQWTLPLLGALTSCIAFVIRMDPARVFLIFSIASFVMLAPFAATFALHGESQRFAYLSICSLSFTLWALSMYEGEEVLALRPAR